MNAELTRQIAARKKRLARFSQAGNPAFDRPINLRPARHDELLPPAPPLPVTPKAKPKPIKFPTPFVTLPNNAPLRLPLHIITIQGAVCEYFNLTRAEIIGPVRTRRLVRPRQIAMFLTKEFLPQMSLPQIGRKFGGRDHTTTLHGIRTIGAMMAFGHIELAKQVDDIRAMIRKARGDE